MIEWNNPWKLVGISYVLDIFMTMMMTASWQWWRSFDLYTWWMAELAVETWSVVCQSGDLFLSTLVIPPNCSLMHLHGLTFTYWFLSSNAHILKKIKSYSQAHPYSLRGVSTSYVYQMPHPVWYNYLGLERKLKHHEHAIGIGLFHFWDIFENKSSVLKL